MFGWLEHHPIHQNVGGSIPSWAVYRRQATNRCFSHISVFSFSLPLSLKSINISLGEDFFKKEKHVWDCMSMLPPRGRKLNNWAFKQVTEDGYTWIGNRD